jgi:hypothetical protein
LIGFTIDHLADSFTLLANSWEEKPKRNVLAQGKVGDETAGRKEVEEKCPRRESAKDETDRREMAED